MFWIPVVVSIVLTVSYSFVIHCTAQKDIWSWYHTLISTVVAVTLSVSVGIALFGVQQDSERHERYKQLGDAVLNEANGVILALDSISRLTTILEIEGGRDTTVSTPIVRLQTTAIDAAIESGLFDSSLTQALIVFSMQISTFNLKTDMFIAALNKGTEDKYTKQRIISGANGMLRIEQAIRENCVEVCAAIRLRREQT